MRRWWSAFLLSFLVSAGASALMPQSAEAAGPSAIPGLSKMEDAASQARDQFERVVFILLGIAMVVACLQIARGNGQGWYMLMGVIAAMLLAYNRANIQAWLSNS